ncbi:MAG: helix-turn-helix domain-containing protein, partial [Oscillospiraceae bacterium]|nr:helix-turn-helix domain-containing protein [Oscillospiraceae bacterium]
MLDNTRIGNFIADQRRAKGLTGEKFAERLGVSPQAVSKWENGKCLPETALLPEIAAILGVTADEILNPPQASGEKIPSHAGFELLGAWYGSGPNQRDVMHKMRHYDYFRWKEIHVDHESFPSCPGTDEQEALTLVYRNASGIHTISCPEGGALRYSDDGTELFPQNHSRCVLPDIMTLEWDRGMECCWAGALYAALDFMGHSHTYEQIMGLSGACYRLNFTEVWDWSATDALVAFDYCSPLMKAIGYENVFCARLPKEERAAERERIMADLRRGKPVLGINLRVAAEWGVITGYGDNGKIFYCRTYFDKNDLNENKDYLETDNWPFLIQHFGKELEQPPALENLRASLRLLCESFEAPCERGYYQGRAAYERWIAGLRNEKLWTKSLKNKKDDIRRRLGVNESQLLNLEDARRCAAAYLRE